MEDPRDSPGLDAAPDLLAAFPAFDDTGFAKNAEMPGNNRHVDAATLGHQPDRAWLTLLGQSYEQREALWIGQRLEELGLEQALEPGATCARFLRLRTLAHLHDSASMSTCETLSSGFQNFNMLRGMRLAFAHGRHSVPPHVRLG